MIYLRFELFYIKTIIEIGLGVISGADFSDKQILFHYMDIPAELCLQLNGLL